MNILKLENLTKSYKSPSGETLEILSGVNLTIQKGQKVAIIGQSGSGKSTLLHCAGLLDSLSSGSVSLMGQETAKLADKAKSNLRNKHMGFVYQAHHLMADFTALENVLMPVLIANKSNTNNDKANKLLEDVGLAERKNYLPCKLSGGEQQRVAIARSLMNSPDILFADEPTGNLDPHTAKQVFAIFEKLVTEQQMAMLMVTHNEDLAHRCDAVYKLENGVLQSA